MKNFLDYGCSGNKLSLIPDAISDNFKINISKKELKIKLGIKKKFVVAIVGRICKNKKHHLFIELSNILSHCSDEIEFLIVGKIDDYDYYNYIKKLSKISNAKITLSGHIEDMNSLFNVIDILVSFSGGSVMYEAMAWGKIVVSIGFVNQNTSTFLIDKKTALVFEENSLELARDSIIEVLSDKKLFASLSREASKIIKKNLLPKTIMKQVENVYECF